MHDWQKKSTVLFLVIFRIFKLKLSFKNPILSKHNKCNCFQLEVKLVSESASVATTQDATTNLLPVVLSCM